MRTAADRRANFGTPPAETLMEWRSALKGSESLGYSLSPMQQAVKTESAPHRLTIGELLDWMVEDQLVTSEAAEDLKKERRYYRGALHPLVIIAEQKWRRPGARGKLLAVEALTEGLPQRLRLGDLQIQPLQKGLPGVT